MDKLSNMEKIISSKYLGKETKLPVTITDEGRIFLDGKRVREDNMQVPGNDFEGWAIATRICSGVSNVVLDISDIASLPEDDYIGHGHVNRFLYRAMKFQEQYDWFGLSDELNKKIEKFKKYLNDKKFVNNVATKEAGNTYKIYDENAVEAELSNPGKLKDIVNGIGDGSVYRQLPVGLFVGTKAKTNAIFTYGKSAIDLWNINGDTINIIELKTKNPMLGIITEIFFYSNYIYDFIMQRHGFKLSEIPKVSQESYLRGYDELYNTKDQLKKVNGIMLTDDVDNFHPIVEDSECLKILNDNKNNDLNYFKQKYQFESSVKVGRSSLK